VSEKQPEVGAAMWGPNAPLRRRPVEAVPDEAPFTIDVRDAVSLALIVLGCGGVVTVAAVAWGWLGLGFVVSLFAVVAGVARGYRGGER
jgi:hypothetical protein